MGAKGSYGAYFEVSPKTAIEVSVSDSRDLPGGNKNIKIGEGPVLRITHGNFTSDIEVINELEACAEKSQREAAVKGITEMLGFGSVDGVAKSASIGIACRRYSETAQAVSLEDAKTLSDMLVKYIEK